MSVLRPRCESGTQRLLRVGVVVLVSALGGAVDVLNNSFALWLARTASFPEEEHQPAKDRGFLVVAAQPSRKGGLRPTVAVARHHTSTSSGPIAIAGVAPRARSAHQPLTGAGIFQHC